MMHQWRICDIRFILSFEFKFLFWYFRCGSLLLSFRFWVKIWGWCIWFLRMIFMIALTMRTENMNLLITDNICLYIFVFALILNKDLYRLAFHVNFSFLWWWHFNFIHLFAVQIYLIFHVINLLHKLKPFLLHFQDYLWVFFYFM